MSYKCVVPGGAGVAMAPPVFGRSINPISTWGDRLCPPNYYLHLRIFRPSDGPGTKSVGISMASCPAAFLQEIQFHAFPLVRRYFYRPVGAGGARGTIGLTDFDYLRIS